MVPAIPNLVMAMATSSVLVLARTTALARDPVQAPALTLVREATRVVPITLVLVVLGRERMEKAPPPRPVIPTVPPTRSALAANASPSQTLYPAVPLLPFLVARPKNVLKVSPVSTTAVSQSKTLITAAAPPVLSTMLVSMMLALLLVILPTVVERSAPVTKSAWLRLAMRILIWPAALALSALLARDAWMAIVFVHLALMATLRAVVADLAMMTTMKRPSP